MPPFDALLANTLTTALRNARKKCGKSINADVKSSRSSTSSMKHMRRGLLPNQKPRTVRGATCNSPGTTGRKIRARTVDIQLAKVVFAMIREDRAIVLDRTSVATNTVKWGSAPPAPHSLQSLAIVPNAVAQALKGCWKRCIRCISINNHDIDLMMMVVN
ncbi:hypothetical protein PM082_012816 [Marasmius tenuissimus]|nr:hypothetical protein PM082_012816 [Marasmius tenuissimus]